MPALITFFVLLVLVIWILKCLKYLHKRERGVVFRLGRMLNDWSEPLGPGLKFVWWPVDSLLRWNICTGEEELDGAEGEAVDDIHEGQKGLVRVAGKYWFASSSQAIPGGRTVRVIGSKDLNLLVEPGTCLLGSGQDLGLTSATPIQQLDRTPPWEPRISGVVALLFGPLAGALVAHLNLKRLGRKRRAEFTLQIAVVTSFLAIWLLMRGSAKAPVLIGIVVQILGFVVFPLIQKLPFEQWISSHPGISPRKGWTALGWGILGAIGLLFSFLLFSNS